ncbi:MAG: F0F1 ATP synthase subunit delta [Alphaproteobacteria bacterium]|nr:F0F1 ATP synthase subunit delta [Alphaproteobacteria bacterium]
MLVIFACTITAGAVEGPQLAEQTQQVAGVSGIAGRYATAIFELTRDAGQLDAVAADLASLTAMLANSADLTRLVRSPVFSRTEQGKAMAAVLERMKAQDLTRRFIGLVAAKRRLFVLPAMIAIFNALLAQFRGEVTARVTSAHPLDKAQLDAIAAVLKQTAGQDVQLQADVDNSLLGGLIVRTGSRMIDSSLRTKLNNLQIAMKEVG